MSSKQTDANGSFIIEMIKALFISFKPRFVQITEFADNRMVWFRFWLWLLHALFFFFPFPHNITHPSSIHLSPLSFINVCDPFDCCGKIEVETERPDTQQGRIHSKAGYTATQVACGCTSGEGQL